MAVFSRANMKKPLHIVSNKAVKRSTEVQLNPIYSTAKTPRPTNDKNISKNSLDRFIKSPPWVHYNTKAVKAQGIMIYRYAI
jgi:hypothetical protein